MMNDKCHMCKHYILEYAPLYKAYIEGCEMEKVERGNGCKYSYEPKEKPKAYIKRRVL